ncbi:hypothetical protein C8R45DRAFT_1097431 [Mycena sanguinolenta]|nr:hypothetical protein C8R45DRAFT_1097431 [Mycena sanguinolenta]
MFAFKFPVKYNRKPAEYDADAIQRHLPPTWACYEQIHGLGFDKDDDEDVSLSESDGDEMEKRGAGGASVEDGVARDMEMDVDASGALASSPILAPADSSPLADDTAPLSPPTDAQAQAQAQANAKGKQRAVDSPPPRRPHAKKARAAQGEAGGFVWNQDLFVPPYIKDRCTSPFPPFLPPSFLPSFLLPPSLPPPSLTSRPLRPPPPPPTASSTNSALTDYDNYELEVVEICVQEGEFAGIIA